MSARAGRSEGSRPPCQDRGKIQSLQRPVEVSASLGKFLFLWLRKGTLRVPDPFEDVEGVSIPVSLISRMRFRVAHWPPMLAQQRSDRIVGCARKPTLNDRQIKPIPVMNGLCVDLASADDHGLVLALACQVVPGNGQGFLKGSGDLAVWHSVIGPVREDDV